MEMYSPKQHSSIDDPSDINNQVNTPFSIHNTSSDVDSPVRSYALIETNPYELDHIIDLLRQFFPKTKIIEYNTPSHSSQKRTSITSSCSSYLPVSSKSSFESDNNSDYIPSNTSVQTFKGKVKDYLQRRYLEQIDEHQSRKETFTKSRSDYINSFDLPSSSAINKSSITTKSRSLDLSSPSLQTETHPIIHSQSKRGLLQRGATIDMDDASNDAGKITFSIYEPNDDEDEPYSEPNTTNKNKHLLLPYHHSCEQELEKRMSSFPGGIPLPLTPYSTSSDPGPFHSPWFGTPTSPFNFRFPQSQEQLAVNAQGSIAQLSTLTKMLCKEPNVYTPISPRFKTEKYDSNTSTDSSSIPSCQICRQEFDSRQMYLTHLENSCEDDKSDSDANCDRFSNLRNYSCKICSKRFSRDMLNRHLRLHSGIRPYRCTMCNTHFSRSDHLSTHLRTHTGEKPYTCPECAYTACRRDMITRHLKIHTKHRSERKNATSTFASSNES